MNKFTQKQEQVTKTVNAICDHSQEFGDLVNFLDKHISKPWWHEEFKLINIAPIPITAVFDREFVVNMNFQSLKYYNLDSVEIIKKRNKKLFVSTETKAITINRLLQGLAQLHTQNDGFQRINEIYSKIYREILQREGDYAEIPKTGKALPAFYHTPLPDKNYQKNHFRDSKRLANIILMPSLSVKNVIYMFTLTTPIGTDNRFYENSCDHFISEQKCKLKNTSK